MIVSSTCTSEPSLNEIGESSYNKRGLCVSKTRFIMAETKVKVELRDIKVKLVRDSTEVNVRWGKTASMIIDVQSLNVANMDTEHIFADFETTQHLQ